MAETRKNKLKQKKPNSKRGGKLLGKGMYGWAFMPPLKCPEFNPSADDKNRYISKTFVNEKKAKEEYEKGMLIKPLDPEGKFFITPEAICSYEDIQENTNWDKFIEAKKAVSIKGIAVPKIQIIYKYGGTNIENVLVKNPPYYKLPINFSKQADWELLDPTKFGLFIRCLKGFVPILDRLHAQFIHSDLHVGNMIYDETQGVRLIDFGEAVSLEGMKPPKALKMKLDEYAMLIMIGWNVIGSRWGMTHFPKVFMPWVESVMMVIGNKKSTLDDYRALMLSMPEV